MLPRTRLPARTEQKNNPRAFLSVQDTARKTARAVNGCPFIEGVAIGPVTFGSGSLQQLVHGLGYQPTGWIVTDLNSVVSGTGDFQLYRLAWDDDTITITSPAAACVASFWVY